MPDFKFINAKRPFGRFRADKKTSEIGISAYRKGWSVEFLKDTLIHEMIHQYVYECMSILTRSTWLTVSFYEVAIKAEVWT